MGLEPKEKKHLKSLANRLKPEVWIGKAGLTDGIIETAGNSLRTKELVKVKVLPGCEMDKKEVAANLAEKLDAEVIQVLGNITVLYRKLSEEGE
jgi:RNA-binding protein